PEIVGGDGGATNRTSVYQTADPRALHKPDLFRQRLLRSRDRFPSVFRKERLEVESFRSSAPGGIDQEPKSVVTAEKSGSRKDPTQIGFGSNGSINETFACGCGSCHRQRSPRTPGVCLSFRRITRWTRYSA